MLYTVYMKQRGFSLIELLTVIAIILIMVVMVLGNTRGQSDRAAIEKSADDLVALFRQARQDALSVRKLEDRYPSYGVHLVRDGTTAVIYADCVPDDNTTGSITDTDTFQYVSSGNSNCTGAGGGNTISETLNLQNRTKISKITTTSIGDAPVNQDDISILFLRPEPTIWLAREAVPHYIKPGTTVIELTNNAATETVTVSINSAGFVRIN